jgi:hypothetical protein
MVLMEDNTAKVTIPSAECMAEFQLIIRSNYPSFDDIWSVMDG